MKADHRTVEQLFRRLKSASGAKTRKNIAERIIRELSIHASIEELIVYPKMREKLPDGDELVEEAISEHKEAEKTLKDIERMEADEPEFDERMRSLIGDVRHHVEEEEAELFPKFRKAMSREDLMSMAESLRTAKKAAPTRPHPRAPKRPPANIANVLTGLVDRVRDAASGRAAS